MNEDMFLSYCGKINPQKFKVAPVNIAYKFSWDFLPKRYFNKNNHKLPFGCHGWHRCDTKFYLKLARKPSLLSANESG